MARPLREELFLFAASLREGVKKPISYGPVRNVLSPPPPVRQKPFFGGLMKKYMFFFKFSICILKDAEWSKMYVFHERNFFGSKGKILYEKFGKKFFTDTVAKMSQNIFAYFSISEHSASFLFFRKKTILVNFRGFTVYHCCFLHSLYLPFSSLYV